MWVIRDKEGDARPVGHGAFDSKKDAIKQLKRYREIDTTHAPYTLYHLTTRAERLKRKLLSDAIRYIELAKDCACTGHETERAFYLGMVRAMRDVASQL